MSKYTTQVRFICETESGLQESVGFEKIEEVLDKSWNKIFTSTFEIFAEEYRPILCKKILRYFYTREIGVETVGLWKHFLNTRMMLIMPYYNKLYKAWEQEINPLNDTNLSRKHTLTREENSNGTSNGTATTNDVSRNLYSDTPQGALTELEKETYLTNARKIMDDGTSTSDSSFEQTANTSDDFVEEIIGKSGGLSVGKTLDEFRQSLVNIDMLVIGELENLFMMIW